MKVWLSIIIIPLVLTSCGVSKSLHDVPDVSAYNANIPERTQLTDSSFILQTDYLTKNKQGQWELFVHGNPLQIGLKTGRLTSELFKKQEDAFLSKVNEMVPSKTKQYMLRKLLAWYNRKMYLHVPEEYKTEIYGLSKFAGDKYDHVADDYLRVLYLHGAHDIGHAFQDLALVGCSSFAAWGDKSEDGHLIIGRNFDFYAGDAFSKEKIIAFVSPTNGHKFMSVTWPGMIGVVSGMNDAGLTVTINAGKSKIPLVAKTPISIVTREILQYASNIEEAIAIAKKRQVFVSESIFIGSAQDNRAITIEMAPDNFGVYEVENSTQLICSNHFQSDAFKNDERNLKHMAESHSQYRYKRMEELLSQTPKLTPQKAVDILRNKKGLNNKTIGYGNEKALNQLLAHHAIVFKPEQRMVWVSSNPYQLGEFVAYNLNDIFKNAVSNSNALSLQNPTLNIEEDPFLYTQAYQNYERYRILNRKMLSAIKHDQHMVPEHINTFKNTNPEFWEVHYVIAKYYYEKKYYRAALNSFKEALTKEITTVPNRIEIEDYIKKLNRKLH
ncbi:acyl-CoA:6-aminopenicillanic acid acyl-transferase [Mangrovimonas yunxiaonensis]|uniref:Acyl-CoA:6-aminopenicillanic acid acyl-transferase n=1 Tax=Mangrovimonas yunxiaonensis TaxID=1197477 RepID=A0A084TKA3_9FLAO|nr:acyl-CoA--6-aminopenicillanic acid acyl-transferase [Mangrovimonas yunxiaonensis]KFB01139.1 acyl-CoA:6-aminopenicillanic acid acyl-transferase [Mangrovimonas yunxiaonensis]GGH38434.1 acyl-CoA--6-aminopenicillanic acid acyl-transferase [Mangrovimonas yunxiaonensis]